MIYVVGAANIDFIVKMDTEIIKEESNCAKITFDFGGVGKNIAENLKILNTDVKFITSLGEGLLTEMIKDNLSQKDIDYIMSVDVNVNQSTYLSILNNNGELYEAFNDMRSLELANIEEFDLLLSNIRNDDILVFDANFPSNILRYLVKKSKCYKVFDGTSACKCIRINNFINEIDLIKLNKNEAEKLSDNLIATIDDFIETFKILRLKGANDIIITDKSGLYYLLGDKLYFYSHNVKVDVVSVTGAGDALLSGIIKCKKENQDFDYSVKFGLALAIITLKSYKAVADYNINTVKRMMLDCDIKGEMIYEFKD